MSTPADRTSWNQFPAEVRNQILTLLLSDGCSLAGFATVSREWQTMIEHHTFAQIKVTDSRLADFGPFTRRNRALVRRILVYLFTDFYTNDQFPHLFSILSQWEPTGNGLVLDFRLIYRVRWIHTSSSSSQPYIPPRIDHYIGDGWAYPIQRFLSSVNCLIDIEDFPQSLPVWDYRARFPWIVDRVRWWETQPLVPAVTGMIIPQDEWDFLSGWAPCVLRSVFSRFPGLGKIEYEPQNLCLGDCSGPCPASSYFSLSGGLAGNELVLFTDYSRMNYSGAESIRLPTSELAGALARASQELEKLSASYGIDASPFLDACGSQMRWRRLASLVLTSRLLTPDGDADEIDNVLQQAAEAAERMPKLELFEVWNETKESAALFSFRYAGPDESAEITWRGTWSHDPPPSVLRVWRAVALGRGCDRLFTPVFVREDVDRGLIRTREDAIRLLKLSTPLLGREWGKESRRRVNPRFALPLAYE